MESFIAIDFETANQYRSSICSVGLVMVENGSIRDRFYSLIKPNPNFYCHWATDIHGINYHDTIDARPFPLFGRTLKEKFPVCRWLPTTAPSMKVVWKLYMNYTTFPIPAISFIVHTVPPKEFFLIYRIINYIPFPRISDSSCLTITMPWPMRRLVHTLRYISC